VKLCAQFFETVHNTFEDYACSFYKLCTDYVQIMHAIYLAIYYTVGIYGLKFLRLHILLV